AVGLAARSIAVGANGKAGFSSEAAWAEAVEEADGDEILARLDELSGHYVVSESSIGVLCCHSGGSHFCTVEVSRIKIGQYTRREDQVFTRLLLWDVDFLSKHSFAIIVLEEWQHLRQCYVRPTA